MKRGTNHGSVSYTHLCGCYMASKEEQEKLMETVFTKGTTLNRKCVGRDAKTLLGMIGVTVPDDIRCIIFEGEKEHPLIATELMMPILGIVRAKDIDDAIEKAVWLEHGNRHSAHMHSKNIDNLTRYGKAIDTAIFVKNAPSYAALGFGGEGYCTCLLYTSSYEWLESEFDTIETRSADPFYISEETKDTLRKVYPYWKGRTTSCLLYTSTRTYHPIKVCRSYRSQDLEAAGCAVNVLSHVFSGEVEL